MLHYSCVPQRESHTARVKLSHTLLSPIVQWLRLKFAIESDKTSEQKQVEVFLLLDLRAPVPRTGQATVNARPTVVAVAIEPMLEKVTQNLQFCLLQRPVLTCNVPTNQPDARS